MEIVPIEATTFSHRGQHAHRGIEVADKIVKHEPHRNLDGVLNLLPDNHSTEDMTLLHHGVAKHPDGVLEDAASPARAFPASLRCVMP